MQSNLDKVQGRLAEGNNSKVRRAAPRAAPRRAAPPRPAPRRPAPRRPAPRRPAPRRPAPPRPAAPRRALPTRHPPQPLQEVLQQQYSKLVDKERKYSKLVKDFQLECERNEQVS